MRRRLCGQAGSRDGTRLTRHQADLITLVFRRPNGKPVAKSKAPVAWATRSQAKKTQGTLQGDARPPCTDSWRTTVCGVPAQSRGAAPARGDGSGDGPERGEGDHRLTRPTILPSARSAGPSAIGWLCPVRQASRRSRASSTSRIFTRSLGSRLLLYKPGSAAIVGQH